MQSVVYTAAVQLMWACSTRLMTMKPLCPWSKPCSTGTHNETVKKLALFSIFCNHQWNYHGITTSNPMGVFSILQWSQDFYHIYTITTVIQKYHNLIGTLGISKVGPK